MAGVPVHAFNRLNPAGPARGCIALVGFRLVELFTSTDSKTAVATAVAVGPRHLRAEFDFGDALAFILGMRMR